MTEPMVEVPEREFRRADAWCCRGLMLLGPGRWGTTTPSLGIPVHFSEISNAAVMAEFTYPDGGFIPELSQGSHFFQDLVESGIFYLAIFDHQPDVVFVPELVVERPNRLTELVRPLISGRTAA